MKRSSVAAMFGVACLAAGVVWVPWEVRAQTSHGVQWIWFNEGDPARDAPAETRYFRRVFTIDRPVANPVDEATLDITADNRFTVWVNGVEVGRGDDGKAVFRFDVRRHLVHGKNVLAVEAANTEGPAGLLVRLGYVPNGQSRLALFSDGSWKASKKAEEGWQKVDFDDSTWPAVKVLGPYGKVEPWKQVVWPDGGDDRFTVPPGFRVEPVVRPNPKGLEAVNPRTKAKLPFSLVNLTFDAKGRLLLSQENGPILLGTEPDDQGVFQSVKHYCEQVRNSQGMCWVKDALLLVGDGPQGTGLYRVRDTDGDDRTDEVKLLHKFKGGMGEHGPHAILHGPDDWLYLVIGNHAWAQIGPEIAKNGANPEKLADNSPLLRWPTGGMGPDQGQPGTTEDVLLPRLNDARGHAANILAPGGTIWRLDHEGKNMSLVAAGFRNQYDAAFSPTGELFTFDSDMEWDEGLPWYRAVRVCHCPPGADFVWRTGSANTPDYYIDSLPPVLETGRGSPVGVEFYDHVAFPAKYRGALFLADWAIGVIFAVHLERAGASYKGRAERFCVGAPMNVTDLAVGPDGALYFTMGGRGSQGGVYRIVYSGAKIDPNDKGWLQPLSAWGRASNQQLFDGIAKGLGEERFKGFLLAGVFARKDGLPTPPERAARMTILQTHNLTIEPDSLQALLRDDSPEVRAQAIWMIGIKPIQEASGLLIAALKDRDALVRRRACEALIRAGIEPPVDAVWPLLSDKDRFVRTAARLVLQRIDPKQWADRMMQEKDDHTALEAIIALCKINRAAPYEEPIFRRLQQVKPGDHVPALLDHLRTIQMALIHTSGSAALVQPLAERCWQLFPHRDWRVNRELAILLTHYRKHGLLNKPVHAKLLEELLRNKDDRPQQIHYFYCLRLLRDGWTAEQKAQLLAWYEPTATWIGGHSFTPFLENILRDFQSGGIFTAEDRARLVARGHETPWTAVSLLRATPEKDLPPPKVLAELYERVALAGPRPKANELKEFLVSAIGRSKSPEAQEALRKIAGAKDPAFRDAIVRGMIGSPSAENFPFLVGGLDSTQPALLLDVIAALKKVPVRPKPEDPAPFRALLLASRRLPEKERWQAVELLRQWGNKSFGAEPGEWKEELAAWSKWFAQTFPQEPPLPDVAGDKPVASKYKFEELLTFLEKDPAGRSGDPVRGRAAFEKAQCLKCHKYGSEGEGIGPDLTTVSKRFKRADILESIYYPSRVISDQYRSTLIATKKGQQIVGLAAPQGDTITVLQSDGTKVTLHQDEIERQVAALESVMPPNLLDLLSKQEIADLFAFLESEPK
ncbi:MAG TPA: HEAT repeat domain-containing protein [Gemmataceae bacterium]|nr:HEAT repeat domain-containing protein [Gemmataceae bacterium]